MICRSSCASPLCALQGPRGSSVYQTGPFHTALYVRPGPVGGDVESGRHTRTRHALTHGFPVSLMADARLTPQGINCWGGLSQIRVFHELRSDGVSSTVLPVTPWTSSGRLVRMTSEGSRGATCRRGASQALTRPRLICVANRAMLDDCGEDVRVP